MTVNIGPRHCRSDAVTLSLPSPPPQRPRLLGDKPRSARWLPRPLTAPQPALSFFPTPFCPPPSQGFSLRAQCRDLTSPGALVFPGKLEGLFLSAPSRLLSARVSRPQSQLVPGSEPVQEPGRGVAVRGGGVAIHLSRAFLNRGRGLVLFPLFFH